ncbi:MAG: peptidase domain-containing ABC transporter [Cytophagaceae bacterium]|jgi:ATP-binding cassette subfamily B protein|nr:peptidase domain-containing ABC transporter [Cytophagaceae bacterium]
MNISRKIRKSYTKQIDGSDCGVACLLSIIRYYGGYRHIETLRQQSGTGQKGVTLLGLYQAAKQNGFQAEAFEAGIDDLKSFSEPCILHVVIDNTMQHYVVCYGYDGKNFLIGDPAIGIVKYSQPLLEEKWKTRKVLKLIPNSDFTKVDNISKTKAAWFSGLLKADISTLLIVAVLGLLVTVLGYTMAIFSQQLIDNILPQSNMHKLIAGLILITILQFIRSILGYLRSTFLNIQNRNFNIRLIDRFYSSLLYLPKTFFNNRKTGELVARMDDTSRIQTVLSFIFGELTRDILIVLVSLVIIFAYSNTIGWVTILTIPLFFTIASVFHKKIVCHQREVMANNAKKTSNYINTLENVDTIKAHRKEDDFSNVNKLVYGVFQDKIFALGKVSINMQLITEVFTVTVFSAILSLCSFMVINKTLTVGQLAALFSIAGSTLPSIGNIAFSNIRLQGAKIAFDRLYEFAAIEPEYLQKPSENVTRQTVHQLVVENISFSYPGRSRILFDINIVIEKGKIVSLMGESGNGKTTLLNIIQRFYKPDEGKLSIGGCSSDEISVPLWRKHIGVVPQEISIFNNTLVENICLSSNPEEIQKAMEFCKATGFDSYFTVFPQSYYTVLGEEGINLSGGQKQLVGIARAMYIRPDFLLLDEPTASMDKNTEHHIFNLLMKIKEHTGILLITHKALLAQSTDYIYLLDKGKISCK